LQYQVEDVQSISRTIVPSVQSAHIFGTGYRVYGCRMIPKWRKTREPSTYAMGMPTGFRETMQQSQRHVISGQDVNIFNVMPSPNAPASVNAYDDSNSSCADYVIWQSYMNKSEIDANVKAEQWDGVQAQRLYDKKAGSDRNDPSQEYKEQASEGGSGWANFSTPAWMSRMKTENNYLPCRYRVSWLFMRDRWIVIGEDRFVLYDGEPALPFFPIAKFTSSYNMDEWYGRGLIEIVEDLILTTTLLLNHRMDYLAGTLHPTTWVSERVMEFLGGDKTILDPEPYKTLSFPTNANIAMEVVRERFPEISQQAFYEDGKMDEWIQKISGQPNAIKGMGGQASVSGDNGATGIMALIQQGTQRSMMRAANIEESGIRESLNLTLRFGSIYKVLEDSWIRTGNNGGFPWEKVPSEAISEDYRISVSGTRAMTAAAQTFQKMLQVCQMALTLPPGVIDGPKEMMRQLIDKSSAFDNVDEIVGQGGNAMPPPMVAGMPQPGIDPGAGPMAGIGPQAVPGPMDMANEMASMAGAPPARV